MQPQDWFCSDCGFCNMGLSSQCTRCKANKVTYQDRTPPQLISCPTCKSQVSSQALSCPKCGHPISAKNTGFNDAPKLSPIIRKKKIRTTPEKIFGFFLLLLIAYMAQVYKNLPTSSKDTIKDTTVTAATSPSVNPTEKLTPLEKLTQARINLTQEPGITKLEESIALLKLIPSEAIEFKEAAKLQKKAETQLTQQKTTLAIVGGQPLSSAWDNEVIRVVVMKVKS